MSLTNGSTVIPGWTTVSAELVWGNNANVFGPTTPYGSFFLDLTGYHDAVPYGGVTQMLPTIPGMNYHVSVSLGQYEPKQIYNGPVSAMVAVGSVSNIFTLGSSSTNGNQWSDFELDFVAIGASTVIQIVGNVSTGGHYIGLDNVSLKLQSGGPELLVNGDLENTGATFVPDGNQVMSLNPGSTVIPGWTVVNAEIAWATNANSFGPFTPHGGMFLDVTGYHDSPPYGGISQTVTTTPGQSYRLTFSLGSDNGNPAYTGPVGVMASANATSSSFTTTVVSNSWGAFTFDFIATSTATPLTIVGISTAGGQYIGVDNVSVQSIGAAFYITSIQRTNNTNVVLGFNTQAGSNYAIQGRTDLVAGSWTTLPGTNTASGATLFWTLTNGFTAPREFFRALQVP
jgi:hypothetical protein